MNVCRAGYKWRRVKAAGKYDKVRRISEEAMHESLMNNVDAGYTKKRGPAAHTY